MCRTLCWLGFCVAPVVSKCPNPVPACHCKSTSSCDLYLAAAPKTLTARYRLQVQTHLLVQTWTRLGCCERSAESKKGIDRCYLVPRKLFTALRNDLSGYLGQPSPFLPNSNHWVGVLAGVLAGLQWKCLGIETFNES